MCTFTPASGILVISLGFACVVSQGERSSTKSLSRAVCGDLVSLQAWQDAGCCSEAECPAIFTWALWAADLLLICFLSCWDDKTCSLQTLAGRVLFWETSTSSARATAQKSKTWHFVWDSFQQPAVQQVGLQRPNLTRSTAQALRGAMGLWWHRHFHPFIKIKREWKTFATLKNCSRA